MFAIRLLVSPCSERCSPRLVGRSTVRVPLSIATFMSLSTCWLSSPFGPLTPTAPGLTSISTPSGISIGFLPIRLISSSSHSPDVCDDLSADAPLPGLVAGHDAARGRHDRRTHASEDAWHLVLGDVAAATRAGDPVHAADHGIAVLRVAQANLDHLADPAGLDVEVGDVALLLEDPGHLALQPRGGDLHVLVIGLERVADSVQVIGDRVGQHLPARLCHSGHVTVVGRLAQADPAEAELAEVRAW